MQTTQPMSDNNLNLLRILFIVKACFNFLGMLFFLAYAFMGSFINGIVNSQPETTGNQDPFPEPIFWMFFIIGLIGALICLVFGILTLVGASKMKKRKGYNFIFAVGIINCFTGMLGIALGIFTFIELSKPHVKALFLPQNKEKIGF